MGAERTFEDAETAVKRPVKCCPECAQHYSHDSMFCPFDGTSLEEMIWVAPTDPNVDPLLGSVVEGRYRVDRVLGEGGTGTVYEVTHESLERTFALKVLRRDVASDPALASRFIQEARATATLKHPHIVSITDFGRLPDKTPYFVMERLVGQTLAEVEKQAGKLPIERSVRIVLQVADALGTAHEAGIVHRDLKPENIFLVGASDGPPRPTAADDVRVVDFGAAKIAGATRITKTGIVFGTPHYMSPEQASGQAVDHRADIYALGIMMYELFAGHRPFEADTLMGVLTKHMFVEPPPFGPGDAAPPGAGTLLGALEAVTMRAMAKKPEHRFQTMAALAAELERSVAFTDAGEVVLGPGWAPEPNRALSPPPSELPRAVEGAERAIDPSQDEPVVPRRSMRAPFVFGVSFLVLGAILGFLLMRGGKGSAAEASTAATATREAPLAPSAPPLSSAAPAPPPPAATTSLLRVTTVPPFAEIWQDGHRVGTAPMDLPLSPSGVHATLRAAGFADRDVTFDANTPSPVRIPLDPLPAAARSHPHKVVGAPPTSPVRRSAADELVDPFSR